MADGSLPALETPINQIMEQLGLGLPTWQPPAIAEVPAALPPEDAPRPLHAYNAYTAFVLREKCMRSWCPKTSRNGQGNWGSRAPASVRRVAPDAFDGTARVLLSYEHWPLALWTIGGQLVVNGAFGPTVITRAQQRDLRSALAMMKVPHCLIPFAALAEAGWQWESLLEERFEIIATTKDWTTQAWRPCRSKWCMERNHENVDNHRTRNGVVERMEEQHFLGETLFYVGKECYVCGLDRNDDPSRRMFYLCQLPDEAHGAQTVDAALAMLRPPGLPETALRQGEWFLVPTAGMKPPKDQVINTHHVSGGSNESRGVVVVSAQAHDYRESPFVDWRRAGRHVATRMFLHGPHVYVSGTMRDEEHGALKLGDGKTWHLVVKNLAVAGWRMNKELARAD
jgi:hypothetical protein